MRNANANVTSLLCTQ